MIEPLPRAPYLSLLVALVAACATPGSTSQRPRATVKQQLAATVISSSSALMPRAVTSFGAAELGGFVYTFGGYSGTPHAYQREGQSGELWRLDPATRQFELIATSEPTQGAALVSAHGALLRIGGMRAIHGKGEREQIVSIDEVASFKPGASGWSALPRLPSPRSSHAAALIGDVVYVVGGWQLAGSAQAGTFANQLLALDLRTKQYRSVAQPFALRALAAAPLDGKLVVLGGLDAQANVSRAVHVFDPTSTTWRRASDLPVDGFGIAATSSGDVLYASARDGTLYALADLDGPWRAVGSLALPRFFHQLVALGPARVLALGGISGMHAGPRIRPVESIDVAERGPSVMSFVLENPLHARNRQGAFVHADSLYLFGGNRSLAQHDFAPEDFVREAARLDLASLAWAPMANLPVARQTMQTLVEDEGVLVLGGFGHDGKVARAHAEALRYELDRDQWSSDPSSLPTPRTQFGLTSVDGVRWLFGGLDFQPGEQGEAQFDHPTAVLRAARDEPFRASGIDLRQPRRAFGGALLEGRYYLVGGMASGFAPVNVCEAFEFATSSWHDVACPSATRISPQLVALDGKLYLAGGSSVGEAGQLLPNTSLERYDPQSNSWTTLLEQIPIEPRHLTMLRHGRALLLYSAHDEQGRVHVALITP